MYSSSIDLSMDASLECFMAMIEQNRLMFEDDFDDIDEMLFGPNLLDNLEPPPKRLKRSAPLSESGGCIAMTWL